MSRTANPKSGGSLIERAADVYDFGAALRSRTGPAPAAAVHDPVAAEPVITRPATGDMPAVATIDRERLAEAGFIVPDAPVGTLAEEFRLIKRRLLLRPDHDTTRVGAPSGRDRMIMICSAQPNEGKTFCAVNLALSMASERDTEVLLVDADFAKPQVLASLGLSGATGLIDAIADPTCDVERLIIRTDVPRLSVLPSGHSTNVDTEMLSSERAARVIERLATVNPRRIVILDTAPVLAASPAAILAHRVGRVMMIVRADRTTESALRDALGMLDGCDDVTLLLNGTSQLATNRQYGYYYGADA